MKMILRKIGLCFKAGFTFKTDLLKEAFPKNADSAFCKAVLFSKYMLVFAVCIVANRVFAFGEFLRDYLFSIVVYTDKSISVLMKILPYIIYAVLAVPCLSFAMSLVYIVIVLFIHLYKHLHNSDNNAEIDSTQWDLIIALMLVYI